MSSYAVSIHVLENSTLMALQLCKLSISFLKASRVAYSVPLSACVPCLDDYAEALFVLKDDGVMQREVFGNRVNVIYYTGVAKLFRVCMLHVAVHNKPKRRQFLDSVYLKHIYQIWLFWVRHKKMRQDVTYIQLSLIYPIYDGKVPQRKVANLHVVLPYLRFAAASSNQTQRARC